jgi:hypothetical protein
MRFGAVTNPSYPGIAAHRLGMSGSRRIETARQPINRSLATGTGGQEKSQQIQWADIKGLS